MTMPEAQPLNALIYRRISRENPEGISLNQQEDDCRTFAEKHGYQVTQVYTDDGYSGTRSDRPDFQRMRSALPHEQVGAVVIYDLDRLSRNIVDTNLFIQEIRSLGKVLLCVQQNKAIDLSRSEEWLQTNMRALFNELEARRTGEKVLSNLQYKARQGQWVGTPPIGYQRDADDRLQPNGDATTVQEIFQLYASGLYSYSTLADCMNAHGYKPSGGTGKNTERFGRESIRTILHNSAYLGTARCGGIVTFDAHPPLVSRELWDEVQAITSGRARSHQSPTRTTSGWLTDGILRCTQCQSILWHQTGGRKSNRRYYRCSGIGRRVCSAPMASAEDVENHVSGLMQTLQLPVEVQEQVRNRVLSRIRVRIQRRIQSTDSLQHQQNWLQTGRNAGYLSEHEYQTMQRRISRQSRQIIMGNLQHHASLIDQLLNDLPELLNQATVHELKSLARAVIDEIWIENRQVVRIVFSNGITELLSMRTQESHT